MTVSELILKQMITYSENMISIYIEMTECNPDD